MVQASRYLITSWATHDASYTLTGSSERRYPDSTLRLRCDTELCYMNVTQMHIILVQASAVLPNAGRTVVKHN